MLELHLRKLHFQKEDAPQVYEFDYLMGKVQYTIVNQ